MAQINIRYKEHNWMFDPDKLMNVELMAVEREFNMPGGDFEEGLNKGSLTAVTALIWILLRRHVDPATLWQTIEFTMDEFNMSPVTEEPSPKLLSLVPNEGQLTLTDT